MASNIFNYDAYLVPLRVDNQEPNAFREALYNIPYLLYEVETLSNGDKIAINKPGGKRSYGRLSRDDFMVFIFNPHDQNLWLISHGEISDDIADKFEYNQRETLLLLNGLYNVCCGEEPDFVIERLQLKDTIGIPVETILKVYKWIWGQEDCNYPTKEGRWLSMNGLLDRFGVCVEDFR